MPYLASSGGSSAKCETLARGGKRDNKRKQKIKKRERYSVLCSPPRIPAWCLCTITFSLQFLLQPRKSTFLRVSPSNEHSLKHAKIAIKSLWNMQKKNQCRIDISCFLSVVTGGPLTDRYQLAVIRFHWGNDNCSGSEHSVDGHNYPLEV